MAALVHVRDAELAEPVASTRREDHPAGACGRIATMSVPDSGPVAGAVRLPAMVGRDDELIHGTELALDAAAGRGRLLLIQGEPGIGKTLLLRTILDTAADLIPDVLTGAADEFDQRLPFATLHSCLQPVETYSSQAAKVLELIRGGSAENPVIDAALTLVEERCVASPLAVAVEDLQWADPASLLLLHRLGKVAAQLPLLLARRGAGGGLAFRNRMTCRTRSTSACTSGLPRSTCPKTPGWCAHGCR